MTEISIIDYDEEYYTVSISFDTKPVSMSAELGLSELTVLKEVVEEAIKHLKDKIQMNADLSK